MNWQPDAGPDVARARAGVLGRVRDYFADATVLEVTTPAVSATTHTSELHHDKHLQC